MFCVWIKKTMVEERSGGDIQQLWFKCRIQRTGILTLFFNAF